MRKYIYQTIPSVVEQSYMENTNKDIYEALGKVSFNNIKILVLAENEEEADAIRQGVTDVRMWSLYKVEDL